MQNEPVADSGTTERRVRSVIARVFELTEGEAGGDLRMGSVPRWDSMGHMELIVEIENEFGVTFPTFAIAELTGVAEIVRAIDAQKGS